MRTSNQNRGKELSAQGGKGFDYLVELFQMMMVD